MKNHKKTVVVTGSAGFIGSYICELLLNEGWRVVGVDSLSDFYDVELKKHREKRLLAFMDYRSVHKIIEEPGLLLRLFEEEKPDVGIHLAAQAGVRHSIKQPRAFLESNIIGTFELLEAARAFPPSHMLLASTSSAYGANKEMPYFETAKADHQISFYAATKKATENMAHSYAHLYNLPISIFRFFTVYGPRGRPDMALFKFTKAIISDEKIDIYNNGEMSRDFTYVDDLVYAARLLIDKVPTQPSSAIVTPGDSLSPVAPFRCVNIGNSRPIKLLQYIRVIEKAIGKKSIHNFMPMQAGDVPATWADTTLLKSLTGYTPQTSVDDGVTKFVAWYRDYYNV